MLANVTKQGPNARKLFSTNVLDPNRINTGGVRTDVGSGLDENNTVTVGVGKKTIAESDTRSLGNVSKVIIASGVQRIEERAFKNFESLEEVEINEGTEEISKAAFTGCKNLKKVKLPNSIRWIGKYAFQGCENLRTVDTTLTGDVCDNRAFEGCKNLDLGDAFKYTEIVDDDRFYMKDDNLKKILRNDLPLFGKYGPEEDDVQQRRMGNCWMMAAIASVAYMKPEFIKNMVRENPENHDLVDVTLHRELTNGIFKKEVYTLKKSVFRTNGDESLMSEPDDTIWVQMIEKAYSAYLAKGEERINYNNIRGGFNSKLDRSRGNPYKVMLGREAKSEYSSLGLIENQEKLFNRIRNALNDGRPLGYCAKHFSRPVKDIDGYDVVGWHAYTLIDAYKKDGRYYIALRNTWGRNWDSANEFDAATLRHAYITVDLEEATKSFFSISNLGPKEDEPIPYPNYLMDESEGGSEDKAVIGKGKEVIRFVDTQSLKRAVQVTVEEGVQKIGEAAFSDFRNLRKISMPGSIEEIGKYAFVECRNLEELELGEGIKEIGDEAFLNCNGLKKISIPGSVEKIGKDIFDNCDNLEEVELREGIREFKYSNCKSLKKISIPGSIVKIGGFAFADCESLEEVELNEGIKEISNFAFSERKRLRRVIIPKSVEKIGSFAFNGCINLEEAEIKNPNVQIGKNAFKGCKKLKK